jgi:hypothetical protein
LTFVPDFVRLEKKRTGGFPMKKPCQGSRFALILFLAVMFAGVPEGSVYPENSISANHPLLRVGGEIQDPAARAEINPYEIPADGAETKPWEHPERLFSVRLPKDWMASSGRNDDGTRYALFEFPRLGSGIRLSLREYLPPKENADLEVETLLAIWMRTAGLYGLPVHSIAYDSQKRAACVHDTLIVGDPRRTVFELIKASNGIWLSQWEGWRPNWEDHASLFSQISRSLRFPSSLTEAERAGLSDQEEGPLETSGEVKGRVWWILEPALGMDKPENRKPAQGVVLDVLTAKQTGVASQAGEPPRPIYIGDRFYKSFRLDEQGGFRFRLPPGIFEIRAAGNMVIQIGGHRIIKVEAGSSIEIELFVTGGV